MIVFYVVNPHTGKGHWFIGSDTNNSQTNIVNDLSGSECQWIVPNTEEI